MQQWFYLEDYKNAMIRKKEGAAEVPADQSTLIKYTMKRWLFRVKVPNVHAGEVVCVSGNMPELGSWDPERAIPLKCENNSDIWSGYIDIPDGITVEYKYCVLVVVTPNEQVIVVTFENDVVARSISSSSKSSPSPQDDPQLYGSSGFASSFCHGWLTKEAVVQFKISKHTLRIFRTKYTNRRINIKLTPVNLLLRGATDILRGFSEALEESLSGDNQDMVEMPKNTITEAAVLNKTSHKFVRQEQFGVEYNENEMLIFQSTVIEHATTAYLLDFYIYSSKACKDEPPYHAGFSYILPSTLLTSEGSLIVPITSAKQRPFGEINIDYLVVKPMNNYKCDLKWTYLKYWNPSRSGLDVGHRGAGNSYKEEVQSCAEVRENTIASLKTAISAGADFVEFDVQLSKDRIPIIYHDFTACISLKRKRLVQDDELLEIPIKDLTLEQLRLLKVYHCSEAKSRTTKYPDEDLEDHQPFPTLEQLFESLDPHTGFNVEIKWTMQLLDGTYELYHPTDMNLFLDTILEVVLRCAGERRIIFSCFNPDVCTAIRLKQNRYPVMFLTQGTTTQWDKYKDERCWDVDSAVYFANMIDILGINVHTEDILREPGYVNMARESSLVIFCWGDDNANQETIKYLKSLGMHGIIYDKIDVHNNKEVKESIFLVEARESQKRLIQLVSDEAQVVEEPHAKQLDLKLLDFPRPFPPDVSTATSLYSLESEISDNPANN